jgi:hypothetical protein
MGAVAAITASVLAGTYVVHRERLAHVPAAVGPAATTAKVAASVVRPDDGPADVAVGKGLEEMSAAPVEVLKSHPPNVRAIRQTRSEKRASVNSPIRNPPAATGGASDLEGEVRLLEEADAALRRGDVDTALSRVAAHAAKFPLGALSHEREGVRAIAMCRKEHLAEGKEVAAQFLSTTRNSSLGSRVRAACGLGQKGN